MSGDLLVLVHGLAGTPAKHFRSLLEVIENDDAFDDSTCVQTFMYNSAKTAIFPWQYDPDLKTVGSLLSSFLENKALEHERIVLIAYSAGGLVIRQALLELNPYAIARLSKVIYIACPLEGSDLGNAANWLNIGSKLARDLSVGSDAMKQLKMDWEKSPLSNIDQNYMWGTQDTVARRIPGLNNQRCFITNHDHKNIRSFDAESEHYKTLRGWILGSHTNGFIVPGDALNPLLTPTFSAELAKLQHTVTQMSQEQFALFQRLAREQRLLVEGGAGSGKTILACEKAMRLGAAGLRVGLFCHSSVLGGRLKQLTSGEPNVNVYDFNGYIQTVLNKQYDYRTEWEIYDTPSSDQVYAAIEILTDQNASNEIKFDAIIVDEGQDFEKDWIDVLDISLISQNGLFYIFSDEHQRTKDGAFAFTAADTVPLTTNWRNSEKIFNVVKQFTPRATVSDQALQGTGDLVIIPTSQADALESVRTAIAYVLDKVAGGSIVVLTNEHNSLEESLSADMVVHRHRKPSWQSGLYEFLTRVFDLVRQEISISSLDRFRDHNLAILSQVRLPALSSNAFPTDTDLSKVRIFVSQLDWRLTRAEPIPCRIFWRVVGDKLMPEIAAPRGKKLKRNDIKLGHYFYALNQLTSHDFNLSEPPSVTVRPYYVLRRNDEVPLYNIQHFKGCEADGVVLFIRGPQQALQRHLYVGLSRARYCLYVVCDEEAMAGLHQLYQRGLPKLHGDIGARINSTRRERRLD